uniref:15-hydroxyprostaglandin dehydrogenase [NAD(+)] n=1 Tax=Lygus hesperus TaxID=30085 RepID=A0A0A9X993_LYGHE
MFSCVRKIGCAAMNFAQLTRPTVVQVAVRTKCEGKKKYMDLDCKVALITGGVSGIGFGAANELLCQGAKAVVITGLEECQGRQAAKDLNAMHGHGRCLFMRLDVEAKKMFEEVIKETMARYGSLDILFNDAGVMNDKEWEKCVEVNLNGMIRGCALALEYMPTNASKTGVVINCAGTFGFDAMPYVPIYTATQHGVVGLTKSWGSPCHFEKTGIRIMALCPGVTETDMITKERGKVQLTPEWTNKAFEMLDSMPKQTTLATGKALAYIVKYGDPGTLWPCEANVLFQAHPPERTTFQTKVMDV